jgi:hypothetical protein
VDKEIFTRQSSIIELSPPRIMLTFFGSSEKPVSDVISYQRYILILSGKIEEINLIRGMVTASMANGGIHQKCMKGTRESTLETIEIWRVNPVGPQILWLADVAGAGKSTVAKEVAERWKSQGCLAGRFFFSRDAEETRTTKLFFTTIAQQGLAHLDPVVRAAVAAGIRELINPVSATLEEQCSSIFTQPLQTAHIQALLVLDALDECEPQTCQQLLRVLLPQLANLPNLKLFMTSRPETHIREELRDIIYRELSLRSDEISNSKDVEIFMKQRMKRTSLSEARIVQLIERAGGLFIWAKTVCDLLDNFRGNKNSFIDRILSQKLRQMDLIYRIALEQAIGIDREEESIEAYMNVLSIIVVAYEPMSPNTIDQLLKSSESMDIVNDLRSVLECVGEDTPIRFLHPTFREFLLNPNDCGRYFVDINTAQDLMVRGCLSVISGELEYDQCKLHGSPQWSFAPEELRDACLKYTSSSLQYSCSFWASHILQQNHTISSSLASLIEDFYTSKLLDWTYMVSVQGSIDKALAMLWKLISVESVSKSYSFIQPC